MKKTALLIAILLTVVTAGAVSNTKAGAYTRICPDGETVTVADDPAAIALACDGHAFVAEPCDLTGYGFLGLPTWYKYLEGKSDQDDGCVPQLACSSGSTCHVKSGIDPSNLWLIGLAVLEIIFRLGGLITVGMVIFGGFKYITSQGSPDGTKSARGTIINGFVGMVITIIAIVSVNFLGRFLS